MRRPQYKKFGDSIFEYTLLHMVVVDGHTLPLNNPETKFYDWASTKLGIWVIDHAREFEFKQLKDITANTVTIGLFGYMKSKDITYFNLMKEPDRGR